MFGIVIVTKTALCHYQTPSTSLTYSHTDIVSSFRRFKNIRKEIIKDCDVFGTHKWVYIVNIC